MKTKIFRLFSVVMVLALLLPVTALGQEAPPVPENPERVEKTPKTERVPAEVAEMFDGGMPIAEFLARIDGPIPNRGKFRRLINIDYSYINVGGSNLLTIGHLKADV